VISAGSHIGRINLLIEPLDQVTIGAWAAKDYGILRLAKKSLHFELPAQHVFYREAARQAYTRILAELIKSMISPHSTLPVSHASVTPLINIADHLKLRAKLETEILSSRAALLAC